MIFERVALISTLFFVPLKNKRDANKNNLKTIIEDLLKLFFLIETSKIDSLKIRSDFSIA